MRRISSICFFFVVVSSLNAQTFSVAASSRNAEVNQRIQITYSFDGGSLPQNLIPKVEGMLVVDGPNMMSGTHSFNGVTTSTSEISYEVIFIRPGKFVIPKVAVKTNKGKFMCETIVFQITKGKNSAPIIPLKYEGKELLIVMESDRQNVYLGEPIAIDLMVYSYFENVNMLDIKYPSFDGGWKKDAADAFSGKYVRASFQGLEYYCWALRRVWMIPGLRGTVEFKPVQAQFLCLLNHETAGTVQFNIDAESDLVRFQVSDLPEANRPESFINAVGDFKWSVKLDKLKAKANESIKATVEVTGTGNLPTMDAPILHVPDGFEVYDPSVKNNFDVRISGISGKKTFEFLIVSKQQGRFHLSPFSFSYFDPVKKKYIELKSDSFDVEIEGVLADTSGQKSVQNDGLFDQNSITKNTNEFFGSATYYILWMIPLLGGVSIILFRKKLFFTKKDESLTKLKRAETSALKKLEEQGSGDMLSHLSSVFFQYLSDKLILSRNEITRSRLKEMLPSDVYLSASSILDALDQFRFSPAAEHDLMSLKQKLISFIDEMGKRS